MEKITYTVGNRPSFMELLDNGASFEEAAVAIEQGTHAYSEYVTYTIIDIYGNVTLPADSQKIEFFIFEDAVKIRCTDQIVGWDYQTDMPKITTYLANPAYIIRITHDDVLSEPKNYNEQLATRRFVKIGKRNVSIPAGTVIYERKPQKAKKGGK